ncbi:sodium:solute symporter family protein [Galbibacter pacificus]|uniref:Na+:solute symporter n=1 Tax=Galbibacter pacificus TaxID=2996052 RepID=A0ABT6FNI8_9FLAO|nr:sodium:solute symporter family protein [Galbibacter pacificus]MDG3581183.1 Na+:solute symporter [Galbibacter pacificus]MDG3584661.1 Na+:solute symporter [Galbibacter pacificus]
MTLKLWDWMVIIAFFMAMVAIGVWAHFKNKDSSDYFIASGGLPWWLSGISHHVSGYSGAVFVAYAGLAYTHGFSIYVWWAMTVGISILMTINVFPVRWVRLRKKFAIQSPLEYLSVRYGIKTQQVMAWSGVLLKLFDVAAKWAAIAILLRVFTGVPILYGVLFSGGISIIYITIGGLWAVTISDFIQFIVQIGAGIALFIATITKLGGIESVFTIWDQLPERNSEFFAEPYTVGFALAFLCINTFSYNGGTWNLATKYISSPDESNTKKAAILSGTLYLIWPLILFFPMWAAPVLLPGLTDPTESYGLLTIHLLPPGVVGLVLASMFATTMSMTSSDANTIAAVIIRDILPVQLKKYKLIKSINSLQIARWVTFVFVFFTIVIATQYESFGGILGLIVSWFAALVGPIAVPMLLGMLPAFKKCGAVAALCAIFLGFLSFIFTKIYAANLSYTLEVGLPLFISLLVYVGIGFLNYKKKVSKKVIDLLKAID